ncbi:MAG: DUF4373 domain-containing protein [Flavihumibacter sp.]|nr:DUF4373 domain-containing protein [Flavihumibacter sp.]
MARTPNKGIKYYGVDCNHIRNKKLRLLFKEHDAVGYYVWQCLLAYAYKEHGYYFDLNDEEAFEIVCADFIDKAPDTVMAVINSCLQRRLFDADVWRADKILTCVDMQEQYLLATAERRKKGGTIQFNQRHLVIKLPEKLSGIEVLDGAGKRLSREELILAGCIAGKNAINTGMNEDFTGNECIKGEGEYNRREEIINKREGEENIGTPVVFLEKKRGLEGPLYSDVLGHVGGRMKDRWDGAYISYVASQFFNHYKAAGWKINGLAVEDWTALCDKWMNRQLSFDRDKQKAK